jgi:hypothetical protein
MTINVIRRARKLERMILDPLLSLPGVDAAIDRKDGGAFLEHSFQDKPKAQFP